MLGLAALFLFEGHRQPALLLPVKFEALHVSTGKLYAAMLGLAALFFIEGTGGQPFLL
jgi:hypothetical protein